MIGPLLAVILGGAQGMPAVPEAWSATALRLSPARVVEPAPEPADPAEALEEEPDPIPGPAVQGPQPPMPPRLERAEIRPLP